MKFDPINIETKRLTFTKLENKDCDNLYEIYSNQKAIKYWSSLPFTQIKQANKMIDNSINDWNNGIAISLGIYCKESQKLIGTVNLFNFHEESKRAEIGYMLDPVYWGLGIMTETLIAIIEYLFKDMHFNRLEADIDPKNKKSASLLKNMGFKLEGKFKERWIVNGLVSDSEMYGLTKKEYLKQIKNLKLKDKEG